MKVILKLFLPLSKIFGSLLILFCSGCALFKPSMNPVIHDPEFQHRLANRKIMVVATGSGTEIKNLEKLKNLAALSVSIPDNLVTNDIPLHANTDEERLRYLKEALFNPSKNTIVWALRGGYGSARLIEELNKLAKPKTEKLFIGYSDITALHLFLAQKWNWKPIHGASFIELLDPEKDPDNFHKLSAIISGQTSRLQMDNLKPLNNQAKALKKVKGSLTGGNLTIIQSGIGTKWQMKAAGKIVFFEDINEPGYKMDRVLNQLNQSGLLQGVKGIIFGDFTSPEDDDLVDLALERFATKTNIPVFKTEQFGHGKMNYPLVYNARSEITFNKKNNKYSLIMYL